MPAQTYRSYFDIDDKYYAVVTKELIDQGKVRWDGFYPHDTFIKLLRQTVDVLSGRENKSIWVEGAYGTGKSHAALTLKCLLEAGDDDVKRYFEDYGIDTDLMNRFLSARSEQRNGKLIVVHRVGSSSINDDDALITAVQSSIVAALEAHGIHNRAEGALKDSLVKWLNERPANRPYFNSLLSDKPHEFNGMDVDGVLAQLNSGDEDTVQHLMKNLMKLGREAGVLCLRMDIPQLAEWIKRVISENELGSIVFIWDEFSEFFMSNSNSLTGLQTLAEISASNPFYLVLVTHMAESLLPPGKDGNKIVDRFVNPRIRIELPDNMAFRLMAQAMKETADPDLRHEWHRFRDSLNTRVANVRSRIVNSANAVRKLGEKTVLSDEDMQNVAPMHPYAALILKHIARIFAGDTRSMFSFIAAADPEEGGSVKPGEEATSARAFKWFINHYGPLGQNNLLTVDMLWDFFDKSGHGMNQDAREILDNFEMLVNQYKLDPDQQRVLRTILLMNAICTRVSGAEMLIPTYENIDLAFLGTGWQPNKAASIAKAMVHREAPLQPVLFEEPVGDGKGSMRVIPKSGPGPDIKDIVERLKKETNTQTLAQEGDITNKLKLPDCFKGHFTSSLLYINLNSAAVFSNSVRELKNKAQTEPGRFFVGIVIALSDEERTEAGRQISALMQSGIPDNLLIVDGTTNTFAAYFDNYLLNKAYSEYYLKSDKKESGRFAALAAKNVLTWADGLTRGQFRLYDAAHPNGQPRTGFDALSELFAEINYEKYPYGLENYSVNPTMFSASTMGLGAEYGINQEEKGAFASANPKTKLSAALEGAWKVEGKYWEEPAKQNLAIVQIKRKVEDIIEAGFDKNGRIDVIDIVQELQEPPFGITPCNLTAFVLGFVLKEYANENYFWSNGATRPMSVELMKSAIKGALDQITTPKNSYRKEAIVSMSNDMRLFLNATASVFHEVPEHCGSVDAGAGCPYVLSLPTLMTAYSGSTAHNNSYVLEL